MAINPLYREIVEGLHWNLDISDNIQPRYKNLPKKPRAYLLIACSGHHGITENDILRTVSLSGSRSYISRLELDLKISFKRVDEKNPDGISSHYRYYLASKEDARKVINLILDYETSLLTDLNIAQILDLYPSKAA